MRRAGCQHQLSFLWHVERNQMILTGSSVVCLWRWKVKELDRQDTWWRLVGLF